MSEQWGVWSSDSGGFIATQMWSEAEADRERIRLIAEDRHEAADLNLEPICVDHDEQPAHDCDECYGDEEDED